MTKPQMVDVRTRQQPLRERYKVAPADAMITDHARAINSVETDPFHGTVAPGSQDYGIEWPFGIHRAVGGDHDGPNPGDLLCAALATCLDSTIRMVANRLAITPVALEVDVSAEVDVRGTLVVDRAVPVGFQSMRCQVTIQAAEGTDPDLVEKLLAAAEYSCVVLQTVRTGLPVELTVTSN